MPLTLTLAWRCTFAGHQHRFASLVALLSVLGIAIGVAALLTVSTVMQGLHDRLKRQILSQLPHLIVNAPKAQIPALLTLPHVIAAVPYVEGQVLFQSVDEVVLATLEGYDTAEVSLKAGRSMPPAIEQGPRSGSWEVSADAGIYLHHGLRMGDRVKLLSTRHARYTALGLTPSQRTVTLTELRSRIQSAPAFYLRASFEDARRLLRAGDDELKVRLWLDEPFKIAETTAVLKAQGLSFTDWQASRGDFFRAVAMEKLTMSVMLCLIIVVAAFNILSALSMMVCTRLKEIAILKTLGLSPGRILRVFLTMGMGCGVAGTLLGLALGIPLALNAGFILRFLGAGSLAPGDLPATLDPVWLSALTLGCLLLSLLCTLYPAYRAAATEPVRNLVRG